MITKKTFPGQVEFCDYAYGHLLIGKRYLSKATSKREY